MLHDPFLGYNSKFVEVNRGFLDEEELSRLQNKELKIERIALVRDVFLFSCYTGLSFIDAWNLTKDNIGIGIDGNKWIFTARQKTKIASHIPLLPIAEDIIKKYEKHPMCVISGKLLPVLSNQKMNAYLKEIADLCEITKELTFILQGILLPLLLRSLMEFLLKASAKCSDIKVSKQHSIMPKF
jgi:hypothetical protein